MSHPAFTPLRPEAPSAPSRATSSRTAGMRAVAACAVLAIVAGAAVAPARAAEPITKRLDGVIQAHCIACHDPAGKKGGLDFTTVKSDLADRETTALWVRVHDRVAKGEMPPKKPLPAAARNGFLAELSGELTRADLRAKGTVLRRMNRNEYENTLRDMLGIRTDLAELLPEDGRSHGFDTVGEALDLSAIALQRYLDAATRAIDAAVRKTPMPETQTLTVRFGEGRAAGNIGMHWHKRPDGAIVFFSEGGFPAITLETWKAPAEGRYRFRLLGAAHNSKDAVTVLPVVGPQFSRSGDIREAPYIDFAPGELKPVEVEAWLRPGDTLRIFPRNLSPGPALRQNGPDKYDGPGLAVQSVEVHGPILTEWPGRGHKLLFGDLPVEPADAGGPVGKPGKAAPKPAPKRKDPRGGPALEIRSTAPEADARRLLTAFLPVAFRRPVAADAVTPYFDLFKARLAEGESFETAMRAAYTAILCSPDFLYLREPARPATAGTPAGTVDDHALAARLSFFLWRAGPDAELTAAATRGDLSKPAGLRAQTERLLADPRARRFVTDFVAQWLNLREIDFTTPDRKLYPEFDDQLRHAIVEETEHYFAEMLRADRPLTEFVHSDWTFVNQRLALHYGIAGVTGSAMRKVALNPEHARGGVLTQASVLKVSANGTTTSPVVRGAWVLERILDEPPPPPPPGIPGVEPDIRGAVTLREQLDKHRTLPSCNGCHKVIDPPGFALESYDAIGGLRNRYRTVNQPRRPDETLVIQGTTRTFRVALGPKVDASGELPDGRKFAGLAEYKKLLLDEPDRLARAMTAKLATFATGRGMGFSDRPAIAEIAKLNAGAGKRGFRDLIHQLVQSPLFRGK